MRVERPDLARGSGISHSEVKKKSGVGLRVSGPVANEGVGAALQENGPGVVLLHDSLHNRLRGGKPVILLFLPYHS